MALFCSAQAFKGNELADQDVTSAPYTNFSKAGNISSEFCDKMNLSRLTFSISTRTSNQKVSGYKASSHIYSNFVYVSFLCCVRPFEVILLSPTVQTYFFCLRPECFTKYAVFVMLVRWLMSAKRAAGDLFVQRSCSSYGKHSSCFHWHHPSLYKHFKGAVQTVPVAETRE